jgi:predicted Zn finger-like uncharacterized protein
MYTVCPKCSLTLVVTAADLRVAQGYVRCGRCLNVFNALARLSEERPSATPEQVEAAATQLPAPAPASAPSFAPLPEFDETGEIEIELDVGNVLVTSTRPPVAPAGSAPDETLVVEEPDPTALVPDASHSSPAAPVSEQTTAQPTPGVGALSPEPEASLPAEPPAQISDAHRTNTLGEPPESAFELAVRRPRAGLGWTLGAGALAIVLALQAVNHYRDALAANPALTGLLTRVYSTLGVTLAPRWNIHAYDVRQLGASAAGATAGEIVVRASVKNSASRAQPLPLLRVTLQDRFGNRIAARDVPPDDYLPSSTPSRTLLAAGGRVDATMLFVDPGPQAVGFEIDACLRQQSGEVACAHGQ